MAVFRCSRPSPEYLQHGLHESRQEQFHIQRWQDCLRKQVGLVPLRMILTNPIVRNINLKKIKIEMLTCQYCNALKQIGSLNPLAGI